MKKITVIIPTYCPGNYLYDCLRSLKAQTLQDFSCLIVLNGPREPYETQITEWLEQLQLKNAELFYSEEKGVSAARNFALDQCSSGYVTFLDDDDMIEPEFLEQLSAHAADDRIVSGAITSFPEHDPTQHITDYYGREFRNSKNAYIECSPWQCRSIFGSACCKLIPISKIKTIRFNKKLFCGEDSLFMFQILANRVDQVHFVREVRYRRRLRSNSVSRKHYPLGKLLANRLLLIHLYGVCYLKNIHRIPFWFYVRSILASVKGFFLLLRQR